MKYDLAQLVRGTNLFGFRGNDPGVSPAAELDTVERAVASARLIAFDDGQLIVREGDAADSLYVVAAGEVVVHTATSQNVSIELARLGVGAYFGEQALLSGVRGRRSANVSALRACELLEVPYDVLATALAQDHPLRRRLEDLGAEQLEAKLAAQSTLFRRLRVGDSRPEFREVSLETGEYLFRQGEPARDVYLVMDGCLEVIRDEESDPPGLVAKVEVGMCVGELGILEKRPRAASVRAAKTSRVLAISGDMFQLLLQKNPELREYLVTLSAVYQMPKQGGFITQHGGHFLGRDCITTIFHLPDNRSVVVNNVIGAEIYQGTVNDHSVQVQEQSSRGAPESDASGREMYSFSDPAKGILRKIQLDSQRRIIEVSSRGQWEDLRDLHVMMLDGAPLARWQTDAFQAKGTIRLELPVRFETQDELACSCVQVTNGEVLRMARAGFDSLEQIRQRLGCASVCGGCAPSIQTLLGESAWAPAKLVRATEVATDTRALCISPHVGKANSYLPGQHIVLQGRVDGTWIERAYTLCGSGHDPDHYEITVKLEPRGKFTTWVFQRSDTSEEMLRVSDPQGSFTWTDDDGPAVCLVAGIGVTPAVGMARAAHQGLVSQALHIHYSCRHRADFAYVDELNQMAATCPGLSIEYRCTSESGRLERVELAQLCQRFPGRRYYLCGPDEFLQTMKGHLEQCQVPSARIFVEAFTPSQGAKKAEDLAAISRCPVDHGKAPAYATLEVGAANSRVDEAEAFLRQLYTDKGIPQAFDARWQEVKEQFTREGTYAQTYDELAYGMKLCWRNSVRCVGRMYWNALQVRDFRHITTARQAFGALMEHIELATNRGNLQPTITVFPPRSPDGACWRIWNPQLIRYAGYRMPGGNILGDPMNADLTDRVLAMGWRPERRTRFDVLPLIIQAPKQSPELFEIPRDLVLEVPIAHPEYSWFPDLALRWYALPAVSDVLASVGGLEYTFAPFNGWYMDTEIGARNFTDADRYNMLEIVAKRLKLDTRRDATLWRDRAALELTRAVVYSYERAGVKLADHHTCSQDFAQFVRNEAGEGREVNLRWSWIVPPVGGSTTPVFFLDEDYYKERHVLPSLLGQLPAWDSKP